MITGQQINRARLAYALAGDEWEGLGRSIRKVVKNVAKYAAAPFAGGASLLTSKSGKAAAERFEQKIPAPIRPLTMGLPGFGAAAVGTKSGRSAIRKYGPGEAAVVLAATGAGMAISSAVASASAAAKPDAESQAMQDMIRETTTPTTDSGGSGGGFGTFVKSLFGGSEKVAEAALKAREKAAASGIQNPFDINATGGSGSGGGGGPGASVTGDKQNLILIAGGAALLLFLLKGRK